MTDERDRRHRQHVRQRFLEQGLEGFQDYEALELLLFFVVPHRDTKPVAKGLIERLGSFKNVIDAPRDALLQVDGVGEAAATLLHFVTSAATRYLQQTSRERFSPEDPSAIIQHCILSLGARANKTFRLICLDANFVICAERDIAEGALNQATVYPRKVMEMALAEHASTLLFVHNHPDGNVTPSEFDKTSPAVSCLRRKP